MTNEQIITRYEREYVKYNDISPKRWREQRNLLLEFAATLGEKTLAEAGYSELQAFAGDLVSKFHVNTVRKKLNMIRPLYSWAYAVGIITPEQYLSIRQVKDPRGSTSTSEPKPYTRAEVRQFWAALDARLPLLPTSGKGSRAISRWERGIGPWRPVWRHAMRLQIQAMVRLALDCGLRASEIHRLTLEDMHYDNEYLVVWRAAKSRRAVRQKQLVPFTQEARNCVYRWLEFRARMKPDHDSPWLMLWADQALQPMHMERFEVLLQGAVGEGWSWHRFRHTCATEWLRAGMPLEKVSKLLGHTTLAQTMCYAEILTTDLVKEVERHEGAFSRAVAA